MKKEELESLTDSQKLNYLVEKVDKLDRAINPPWHKRLLKWSASHWIIVLSLFGILWGMWQMWDEIQMLIRFVTAINDSVESVKSTMSGFGDTTGQVKDTVTDTIKSWKFWE